MIGGARRLAGCLALTWLFCLVATAAAPQTGFQPIELQVSPIKAFKIGDDETRFGALEFRGGLELSAENADFGGLSGIDFTPDGRLVAVADTGFWFTARPVENDGRLTGLVEARIAPILGADGRPLTGKKQGDAEGLRIVSGKNRLTAFVSFERQDYLRRFVGSPDFADAHSRSMRLPKSVGEINRNKGMEAIAIAPEQPPFSGAIVLIAEHSLDRNGNHRGWILGAPRAGTFSVIRKDDFDVTDAAFLANSDLLILERRFNLTDGVGMRIRRIAAADLQPGETVDGRILMEADLRFQIDNMEGMALRFGSGGETLVTLASDDNKNFVQRTILLQFALRPDVLPLPRQRPARGQ